MDDEDHDSLIDKVTAGFGVLLGQVQELAAKNDALEQRLSHVRGEVRYFPCVKSLNGGPMMRIFSSRPEATTLAMIEYINQEPEPPALPPSLVTIPLCCAGLRLILLHRCKSTHTKATH